MSVRDEFSKKVKYNLSHRVASHCSNPECRASTAGPHVDAEKILNVGVAAHITAASPGGPRYDPKLTEEERQSASNGIWLCQTCAKLVDNDVQRYSTETLRKWKKCAEEKALFEIGKPVWQRDVAGPKNMARFCVIPPITVYPQSRILCAWVVLDNPSDVPDTMTIQGFFSESPLQESQLRISEPVYSQTYLPPGERKEGNLIYNIPDDLGSDYLGKEITLKAQSVRGFEASVAVPLTVEGPEI